MIAVEISEPNSLSDKDRTTCTWDDLKNEDFVSKEKEKHRAHWSQYLHEFGLLQGDISKGRASDASLKSRKQNVKVKVRLATAKDVNGEALTFSEKDREVDGRQLKCKWSCRVHRDLTSLLHVACCWL
jgi:hypothetical protein